MKVQSFIIEEKEGLTSEQSIEAVEAVKKKAVSLGLTGIKPTDVSFHFGIINDDFGPTPEISKAAILCLWILAHPETNMIIKVFKAREYETSKS